MYNPLVLKKTTCIQLKYKKSTGKTLQIVQGSLTLTKNPKHFGWKANERP